jgi:response regulator RpfG family c-di-GMP phosphodiesterase
MGSIEYMAPEQARDASAVDIRADVYALGGTMLWALTGRSPFQSRGNVSDLLNQRRAQAGPSVEIGPEVPAGLRAVLGRMLAHRADDRYPTPQAVMEVLRPFLKPDLRDHGEAADYATAPAAGGDLTATIRLPQSARVDRLLIVDDDPDVREFCKSVLEHPSLRCDEAANGELGLEAVRACRYDLVLLDIDMPEMNGREVLRRLREAPPCPHLKVIMFSGRATGDDMAEMLLAGADDYLTKPFSVVQLQARIKASLRFKEAQDRSDRLNQHLLATNRELEEGLKNRQTSLVWIRNSLVLALSKLVEYRDSETGEHLIRLQRYCRCLAEEAAKDAPFKEQIEANFIDMLESCVPLHDIGKATVPDHILLKPGKLSMEERIIMQRHTIVGRDTLQGITTQQALSPAFLQTALDIVCYHHERWDGQGYPEGLTGSDIPLAARIVTIADVYDALRARRVYKPALSHASAVEVMTRGSDGQFDPALLACFTRCAAQFEQIFHELPD